MSNHSENYHSMKEGTIIKISEEELEEDRKVIEKYAKMFDDWAEESKNSKASREVIGCGLLSEKSLSKEWDSKVEDEAWEHLEDEADSVEEFERKLRKKEIYNTNKEIVEELVKKEGVAELTESEQGRESWIADANGWASVKIVRGESTKEEPKVRQKATMETFKNNVVKKIPLGLLYKQDGVLEHKCTPATFREDVVRNIPLVLNYKKKDK